MVQEDGTYKLITQITQIKMMAGLLTFARRSGLERSWGVMLLIMLSKFLNCFSASFICFSDT